MGKVVFIGSIVIPFAKEVLLYLLLISRTTTFQSFSGHKYTGSHSEIKVITIRLGWVRLRLGWAVTI